MLCAMQSAILTTLVEPAIFTATNYRNTTLFVFFSVSHRATTVYTGQSDIAFTLFHTYLFLSDQTGAMSSKNTG